MQGNAKTIMSTLINASLRVDKLQKERFVKGKDGAVYYNFTIAVNDKSDNYGNNVSITDSQTQEEREAKKGKNYLGNGKVVWTDGNVTKAEKSVNDIPVKAEAVEVDLSF